MGSNKLEVKELSVKKEEATGNEIVINTLSPITVYSTLFRKDGRKFTYYFNPKEEDFSRIVSKNLKNKYKAFYGMGPPREDMTIESLGNYKMFTINYKGFIINSYLGRFRMKGPNPLL